MNNSRRFREQIGEDKLAVKSHEQHSDVQSVQNLETIINEGLRVALLEETPDKSLEEIGRAHV